MTDFNAEIARLARLPRVEYDRQRKDAAKRLGCLVETLDKVVREERGAAHRTAERIFDDPEPMQLPTDKSDRAALPNEIRDELDRYIVLPDHAAVIITLWILHTWVHRSLFISPILMLRSPQKRCGKTTTGDIIIALSRRGLIAAHITPAALFRAVDAHGPTVLFDEADTYLKDDLELRGVINSGYRKGACTFRCVGDSNELRKFNTFCPKMIACIRNMPDTIVDRAIVIDMRRKLPGEARERLPQAKLPNLGAALRERLAAWAADVDEFERAPIVDQRVSLPGTLNDRAQDNWRPLFVVAELVGGDWPALVKEAALADAGSDEDSDDGDLAVMLLADIRDVFEEKRRDRLATHELVDALVELEERPWPEWGRMHKPITGNQVARLLKPFRIRPVQIWLAGQKTRGYRREDFHDAFGRYLDPGRGAPSGRPVEASNSAGFRGSQTGRPDDVLPDAIRPKAAPDNGPTGLPVQTTPETGIEVLESVDPGEVF